MNDRVQELENRLANLRRELNAARREAFALRDVPDYTFRAPDGVPVTLRALFAGKRDLLVIHNMGRRCAYCSLWADGLVGLAPHLQDRCAIALSSPDEPAVLKAFAASRPPGPWNFPCVSTAGTTFPRDLGFEPEPGKHWPGVSAFHIAEDGAIRRTSAASFGPGDDFCSLWHFLDLLEDGAADWQPKFAY